MHCRAQGAAVLAGVHEPGAVPKSNPTIKSLRDEGVIVHHLDITNEDSVCKFGKRVKELLEERRLGEQYRVLLNMCKKFQEYNFFGV